MNNPSKFGLCLLMLAGVVSQGAAARFGQALLNTQDLAASNNVAQWSYTAENGNIWWFNCAGMAATTAQQIVTLSNFRDAIVPVSIVDGDAIQAGFQPTLATPAWDTKYLPVKEQVTNLNLLAISIDGLVAYETDPSFILPQIQEARPAFS